MNKVDIANKLADKYELSKKQAAEMMDMLFGEIMNAVKSGEEVAIAGFGTFKLIMRKERMGINPKTQEKISIPASKAAKFRVAKAFKELVK
jgi:DNA-binding protein HU-beta